MEKEKVLEIEFTPVWDRWAWRITKQDTDVLKRYDFKDTDINVISCVYPSFNKSKGMLFIRGSSNKLDDCVNLCTNEEKTIIEEKMKAINEKYGKPKRWRAIEGGWYYSINISGEIIKIQDKRRIFDDDNYDFANYFQTHEQAEKALEKVKKVYQEVWE
ncbi:hypothetical protein EPT55_07740 [Fusobacterium necrophorum]|uniref:hypothetical protein n=1 Tax=Fusobacterium necrophorum TaxID=859 RepID=UPI001010305C|nr:hypothetical protein [Fusobacterium necrophorum]RXZ26906.1 hypothetical protein EPT55_07740 [Fusobacterium necrophorum]